MNAPAKGVEVAAPPTTENCRFCWMCRHMCPVGLVTRRETLTPHAWALTVESVRRGQISWNSETVDVMYACADCGLCQSHCATDQPLPDAIVQARAAIVSAGHAPATVARLDERLRAQGHPYEPRAALGADAGASAGARPRPGQSGTVALFVGDAAHHLAPATVEAAAGLLAAAGFSVTPIGVGRSSGWLPASLGLSATATGLARRALAEITAAGATEVLVLSTADRWAFEHVFPVRLGVNWPTDVVVREVVAVLADAVADGRLKLRTQPIAPFAYHDPCHSARLGRDSAAPRRLLEQVFGRESARPLFWREGRAHPCGAIGGLEFTQPQIARQLAEARLADAEAARAERLITDDPACFHHLRQHARPGVDVLSLLELIAPLCMR